MPIVDTNVNDTKLRLASEVRCQYNGLMNAILNRRQHPTYGYTKADINNRWQQLVGLSAGYALAFGLAESVNVFANAQAGMMALDLNYGDTYAAVNGVMRPTKK